MKKLSMFLSVLFLCFSALSEPKNSKPGFKRFEYNPFHLSAKCSYTPHAHLVSLCGIHVDDESGRDQLIYALHESNFAKFNRKVNEAMAKGKKFYIREEPCEQSSHNAKSSSWSLFSTTECKKITFGFSNQKIGMDIIEIDATKIKFVRDSRLPGSRRKQYSFDGAKYFLEESHWLTLNQLVQKKQKISINFTILRNLDLMAPYFSASSVVFVKKSI